MIKIDGIAKERNIIWKIVDYFWGGFSSLGVIFVLIAVWKFANTKLDPLVLPSPESVFRTSISLLENFSSNNMEITLFRAIAGIGLACVSGIVLGLLAGYYKSFFAFLKPVITVLLSMPPIIWVVMALFWFGFGNSSTIFTIYITVLPLTFSSSALAMSSVSQTNKEVFDVYRLGIVKKIKFLYIPHLTPMIINSIGVALSMGVKIVIMAELLGANEGIGANIADARAMLDTTTVMAYICIVISFIGLFEYLIIKPIEILLTPWKR